MITTLRDYELHLEEFNDGHSIYGSISELNSDTDESVLEEYEEKEYNRRVFKGFAQGYMSQMDDGFYTDDYSGDD